MSTAQPHATAAPLLQLHDLGTGYRQRLVCGGIQFTLPARSVTCLLGANGCGKTTLLKTILGNLPPLRGSITIAGRPQTSYSRAELARCLSCVPQSQSSGFAFTVEEVVLMGRTAHLPWYRTPQKSDRAIALQCLQTLDAAHLLQRNFNQLSGGERQLVLIARALAQQPQILIMDEPTASLDFGNQIRILEQIQALRTQGLAILMTTHQPEHARQVADHIVLLHQGKMRAQGPGAEILSARHLGAIYGLEPQTITSHLPWVTTG